MRIRQAIFVLAAVAAACQRGSDPAPDVPAPTRSDKLVRAAEAIPGQYVAALAEGLGEDDARALVARHGGSFESYVPPPVNAVTLRLPPERAIVFADDAVVRIAEEDSRVRIASVRWNLDRIDQRGPELDRRYQAPTTGSGVHLYVVDTGVLLGHPEVANRADAPASFAEGPETGDCHGHGTHIAAIAAGATVGVAPGAAVHSVRVLDCEGVGAVSDLIRALDWIRVNHAAPAVALVGVTAGLSPTLEKTLQELVKAGVTVIAPAGNDVGDACGRLPAAIPEVVTAGATTREDAVLVPSSQGPCVDLFAPGAEIESAAIDGSPFRFASGTSQAAAHVAGAAALFLEARPDAAPATVESALIGNATIDRLSGVAPGTPNRLLYVGFIVPESTDTTAPEVSINWPVEQAELSGDVTISLTAGTDAMQVAVFVDGRYLGADATPEDGLAVPWSTERFGNGPHLLTARAYDAAGNVGEDDVTVTVTNPGNAAYDAELEAPACAELGQRCASGVLLAGRGPVGPEANAPNTIRSLCPDGVAGNYQHDESIESIEVQAAIPGRDLAEGEWVTVDVTVWAYPDFATDRVDLHFAADAGAPAWQYLGTKGVEGAGKQAVRFSYRLPAFPESPKRTQQAVRATIRYGGVPAACSDGPYDDHDDLAFAVAAGAADTKPPEVSISWPAKDQKVSGDLEILASATDQGGGSITRVEFYADGVLVDTALEPVGGAWIGHWNADAAALGDHALQVVAYDSSGNEGQSDAVPVVVEDQSPPTVRIDLPEENAVVGGMVHIEAIANDNRGVQAVEFRAGGAVIGTATSPPWAIDWDSGTREGEVQLVAVARDGKFSKTSEAVPITLDNTAPTASITSPAPGDTVSGREVPVAIDARDNRSVVAVDLYAKGAYAGSAVRSGEFWVVTWNSAALPNGAAELRARAYDGAGNSVTSDAVVVQVLDDTPPVVAITAPAPQAIVHGVISVSATATDDGVVESVAFEVDGASIGTDRHLPYEVAWNTLDFPDGEREITATATDGAGLAAIDRTRVVVDNTGPIVGIELPATGEIRGDVQVVVHAYDPSQVSRVDVWANEMFLGRATPVQGDPERYVVSWSTTQVDNAPFALVAVAQDTVGNVSTSEAVTVTVKNLTTAEYDATLGAPACASSAAWCFSGTLLDGAGPAERNAPNTLDGCRDGEGSVYHETESIDGITVRAYEGALASGSRVEVRIRYWAYAGNEADQIDVYHAADARDPTWVYLRTITPPAPGENEASFDLDALPTGPLQAIRANFRFAQPGPSTCSQRDPGEGDGGGPIEDDYGDRDDLVFAVDSPADTTAPAVALVAPAAGATVSGNVWIRATAEDDQGIARVEYWFDGALADVAVRPAGDGSVPPRYQSIWPSDLAADGSHTIQVKAYDTSGNLAATPVVTVTVRNIANAELHAELAVPACTSIESFCDSGSLLDGRGAVGPEVNTPNTIGASCLDGNEGAYHQDESLDWIKVSSVDGLPLEAGKRARIEARVWAYTNWSDDALDLFYTSTARDPQWIWLATLRPSGPGLQTLSAEYVLPPGGFQAVRGRFRYGGVATPCATGPYDDHDDVAFAVTYEPNATYSGPLKAPACSAESAYCDSGALLAGRGPLGPEEHAPNTIKALCADGTVGTYQVDPSVEAILVRSEDLSPLGAGRTARVEVTAYASASWNEEVVDLFLSTNPTASAPDWQWAGRLYPSRAGEQVLVGNVALGPGAGTQAIRAHMMRVSGFGLPSACGTVLGTNKIDDHDDLVFQVAP